MYVCQQAHCLLFMVDFNQNWDVLTNNGKILQDKFSLKSIWWESSYSMRTDKRTETTKLLVAFGNSLANAHKVLLM
jgi:hypothetical protein